ncbi:MAG: twin-arginine translocase TatA/TatE family subunit [Solirubrobacterales bacterium]|nr:twin-arginine translocase TatA/TatE family subunit [Solirubrobacterales bacterium]
MPNIGPMELIVVLAIALIFFGPKRLPEMGASIGKGIREFKSSIGGDNDEKEREADDIALPEPVTVVATEVETVEEPTRVKIPA